jgi:hypothetical protein
MKQFVIIPLSRQEEDTMRLIAHGVSNIRHLQPHDVDQLAKLGLVDQLGGGKVALSELGRVRLAQSQELQFLEIIRAARPQESPLV